MIDKPDKLRKNLQKVTRRADAPKNGSAIFKMYLDRTGYIKRGFGGARGVFLLDFGGDMSRRNAYRTRVNGIMSAAHKDKKPLHVSVYYSVLFRDGQPEFCLNPHISGNIHCDYVAAQRIIKLRDRNLPPRYGGVAILASIDTQGRPSNVQVDDSGANRNKASASTAKRFVRFVEQSCFVPAHLNGTPVNSQWRGYWDNRVTL